MFMDINSIDLFDQNVSRSLWKYQVLIYLIKFDQKVDLIMNLIGNWKFKYSNASHLAPYMVVT